MNVLLIWPWAASRTLPAPRPVSGCCAGGELDPALSPDALAHFCLLLAKGSALVTPDLHAVGDEEWAELLTRVVTALARTGITAQTGTAQ